VPIGILPFSCVFGLIAARYRVKGKTPVQSGSPIYDYSFLIGAPNSEQAIRFCCNRMSPPATLGIASEAKSLYYEYEFIFYLMQENR
jgi:hypothetical protein